MKKIMISLLLILCAVSAFAETQPAPAPTTSQNTTPPAAPKESTTNIVDFCRTHTC